MRYFVEVGDEAFDVEVDGDRVLVDGEAVEVTLFRGPSSKVGSLRVGHRSHALLEARRKGDERILHLDGEVFRVNLVDERTHLVREMTGGASGSAGPKPLKAPMPGLVVKVEVEAGEAVLPGQGLVIVEAMKMENELTAEVEGVVAHVLVEAGQTVEKDQILLDFEAPHAAAEEGP